MNRRATRSCSLAVVLAVLVGAACDSPGFTVPDHETSLARSVHAEVATNDLLKAVRQATARFQSTTQAARAGYEPHGPCVEVPGLGAMGYHWINEGLVDDVFDPLRPEALLYVPGRGGQLRLVGVEYIVADIGQDPPMFGDQPFDVNGTPMPFAHWSLHVWLYEANPLGMFEPFNPDVSCG